MILGNSNDNEKKEQRVVNLDKLQLYAQSIENLTLKEIGYYNFH
jgi:hypothetical protein